MRKIIILIVLMLVCLYVVDSEQNIFKVNMFFKFALLPGGSYYIRTMGTIRPQFSFYGTYKLEAQMFNNHFYYGADAKISFWKMKTNKSFSPDGILMTVFAGIRFGNFTIGYIHRCKHPIKTWERTRLQYTQYEYANDEFFIEIKVGNGK